MLFNVRTYILILVLINEFGLFYSLRRMMPNTRRIIGGNKAGSTRPYMVWLRPANNTKVPVADWLCGGVIVHELYILTSAACIEDVENFYVVSGTSQWVRCEDTSNECVNNGALRAVWKCVPKGYTFDANSFDNIRWMMYDLAIVKVEEKFNFEKRVRGCEYVPTKIPYNNISMDYEKAGTVASLSGWGSTAAFKDTLSVTLRQGKSNNSPDLLEADILILSKDVCKTKWPERYHQIIDKHMICAKGNDDATLNALCLENGLNCKDLVYDDNTEKNKKDEEKTTKEEEEDENTRRRSGTDDIRVFSPNYHNANSFRRADTDEKFGGFCENDHGGPLIAGRGNTAIAIGIISACMTKAPNSQCHGPYLFTSIFTYSNLITCAIEKNIAPKRRLGELCKNILDETKTTFQETTYNWVKFRASPENEMKNETIEALSSEKDLNKTSDDVRIKLRLLNQDSGTEDE